MKTPLWLNYWQVHVKRSSGGWEALISTMLAHWHLIFDLQPTAASSNSINFNILTVNTELSQILHQWIQTTERPVYVWKVNKHIYTHVYIHMCIYNIYIFNIVIWSAVVQKPVCPSTELTVSISITVQHIMYTINSVYLLLGVHLLPVVLALAQNDRKQHISIRNNQFNCFCLSVCCLLLLTHLSTKMTISDNDDYECTYSSGATRWNP